jgi:hypothetical protein
MTKINPHYHLCAGVNGQAVNVPCDCPNPTQELVPQKSVPRAPAPSAVERFHDGVGSNYSGPSVNEYRAERAREANAQQRSRLEALRREYATTLGDNPDLVAQIRRLDYVVNKGIA